MVIGILLIAKGAPFKSSKLGRGNSASPDIEFGDIENWQSDSKIGNNLVNRSISDEYRDSGRSGDCDVFGTLEITHLARRHRIGE